MGNYKYNVEVVNDCCSTIASNVMWAASETDESVLDDISFDCCDAFNKIQNALGLDDFTEPKENYPDTWITTYLEEDGNLDHPVMEFVENVKFVSQMPYADIGEFVEELWHDYVVLMDYIYGFNVECDSKCDECAKAKGLEEFDDEFLDDLYHIYDKVMTELFKKN